MTAAWWWQFWCCCRFAPGLRFGAQPSLQLGVVGDAVLAPLHWGGATRLLLHDLKPSARLRRQALEFVAATAYRCISRISVSVRALMLVGKLPRPLGHVARILDCIWREIVGHGRWRTSRLQPG
jgi:hypothetical protein